MIYLILTIIAAYVFIAVGVYDVSDNHGDILPVKLFVSILWIIFSTYMLGRMLCVGLKRWKSFESKLVVEE